MKQFESQCLAAKTALGAHVTVSSDNVIQIYADNRLDLERLLNTITGGAILMSAQEVTDAATPPRKTFQIVDDAPLPLHVVLTPLVGKVIEKAIKSGDTVSLVLNNGGNADITATYESLTERLGVSVRFSEYIEKYF